MKDVRITGAEFRAVQLRSCWDVDIVDCDIGETADVNSTCIYLQGCAHVKIRETTFHDVADAIVLAAGNGTTYTAGPNRLIHVDRCTFNVWSNAVTSAGAQQYLYINHCNMWTDSNPIILDGVDWNVSDCFIMSDSTLDLEFRVPDRTRDFKCEFVRNRCLNTSGGINIDLDADDISTGSGTLQLLRIQGNEFYGTGISYVNTGTTNYPVLNLLWITDNFFQRPTAGDDTIILIHSNDDVSDVNWIVTNNYMNGGVDIDGNQGVDYLLFHGNQLYDPDIGSGRAVWLKACGEIVATSNVVYFPSGGQSLDIGSDSVLDNEDPTRIHVGNNYGFDNIEIDGTNTETDISVTGNHIIGSIVYDGSSFNAGANSMVIASNQCEGISITADNLQDIELLVISGNACTGGSISVGGGSSVIDYVAIVGNMVVRAASGTPLYRS
jgi:hypothetical protein